jgi:hypothetical protein
MKKFMILALLVGSFSAFGATIRVTSFNYVGTAGNTHHPLAELCGVVEGAVSTPAFLNVMVDPTANKPASYNTLADANGNFCLAVITYRGRANVTLIGTKDSTTARMR